MGPILQARLDAQPGGFLANCCVLMVLHILDDLIPLVDACLQAGCEPDCLSVVGIPYSSRPHAAESLAAKGCSVDLPPVYPFDAAVMEAQSGLLQKAKDREKRLLVVEDGGYAVPLLAQLVASGKLDPAWVVGAVEQTTRGARVDRRAAASGFVQWPVVSVPECGSKQNLEPPYIALAVYKNLEELITEVEGPGTLEKVGIFGMGTIGNLVARNFSGQGATVAVGENAAAKRYDAYALSQFEELTPRVLGECDLVMGTTGFTSMGPAVLEGVKDGAVLASSSSRQIEIDVEWLYGAASAMAPIGRDGPCAMALPAGRRFVYPVSGGAKSAKVLYEGYPINFWGKSLPDHVGDAVMALLLDGAALVATEHLTEAGVWNGGTVLQEPDLAITNMWLEVKPDDGIDPRPR